MTFFSFKGAQETTRGQQRLSVNRTLTNHDLSLCEDVLCIFTFRIHSSKKSHLESLPAHTVDRLPRYELR